MVDLVIGLTGGIGSGKSTAAQLFSALGVPVIDADIVSRSVVQPNRPAYHKIVDHFGMGVVNEDGSLNRKIIRKMVFDAPNERMWLEELLHPYINARIRRLLSQVKDESYAILVSPLILETNQDQMVDRILVIDVPEKLQRERTRDRDGAELADVQKIMDVQFSRKQRLALADDVIDNSGSLEALQEKVQELHQHYLKLAELS